jgi:hypothetical protein
MRKMIRFYKIVQTKGKKNLEKGDWVKPQIGICTKRTAKIYK